MLDREHVAAVGERLADGESSPSSPWLHRRPVERAGRSRVAAARPQAGQRYASFWTPAWWSSSSTRPSDAASSVSRPARGAARALADLLAPALDRLALACRRATPRRTADDLVQLGAGGVRLGVRPADDRVRDLGREDVVRTRRASPRCRRRRCAAGRACGSAARAPRRPSCSARGPACSMCRWKRACDHPPWSWRPGVSSVRSAISSSRPPRSRGRAPARGRRRRRARRCRARAAARAARAGSRRRPGPRRRTDDGSASTLQTLSGPAAKTASPRAPSRSNSPSKYCASRSKSAFSPALTSCARSGASRRATAPPSRAASGRASSISPRRRRDAGSRSR